MKFQLLVLGVILCAMNSEESEKAALLLRKLRDTSAYIYPKDPELQSQVFYVNPVDLIRSVTHDPITNNHGLSNVYLAQYVTTPRTYQSQIGNPQIVFAYRPKALPHMEERSNGDQLKPVLFNRQKEYSADSVYTSLGPYIHLPYSPQTTTYKTVLPQHIVKYQVPEKSSPKIHKYKPLVKSVELVANQGHPYEFIESGKEHYDHESSGGSGKKAEGHYEEGSSKYGKESSSKKGHHTTEDHQSAVEFGKGEKHRYKDASDDHTTHEHSSDVPDHNVKSFIPLPFVETVSLEHNSDEESHLKEVGGEYGEEKHGKKGEKSSSGHSSEQKYSKGKKEHYSEDEKKNSYDAKGKEHTKYHDDKDQHGHHQEQGESTKNGEFGEKKKYKKGSKTEGYHNTFHKDEFVKDHTFYDDLDHSGHFKKYEKYHKDFHLDKAKKSEGDHLQKGFEKHQKSNSGKYNKGHADHHLHGFNGKHGHNQNHNHGHHHNKNGHKHHHNHHGYVYHH